MNKRLFAAAPSAGPAFNILTWTGDGSATRSFTGLGFQPDWVVIRKRDGSSTFQGDTFHYNSISGADLRYRMNVSSAPNDEPSDYFKSFDSDGFSIYDEHNSSGSPYVAWCWRFNGGTTSTNTSCTNDSIVQLNPDFPMAMIKSDGSLTGDGLLGHGMTTTPKWYMTKKVNSSEYQFGYTNLFDGSNDGFKFDFTSPFSSGLDAATSTCIDNVANSEWMHWAFADSDICKVGTYTGTGSSGNSVTTGFNTDFIFIKGNGNHAVAVFDSVRGGNKRLYWGYESSESDSSTHWGIVFGSNGFTINGTNSTINSNNVTYFYMAFSINT